MGAFERPKSQPSSLASEPRISGGRGGTRYQHLLKLPSSFTSASSKCTIYPTSESPGTLTPDLEDQNHAWGSISNVLKSPIDSNARSSLRTTALVHVASVSFGNGHPWASLWFLPLTPLRPKGRSSCSPSVAPANARPCTLGKPFARCTLMTSRCISEMQPESHPVPAGLTSASSQCRAFHEAPTNLGRQDSESLVRLSCHKPSYYPLSSRTCSCSHLATGLPGQLRRACPQSLSHQELHGL